MYLMQLLIMIGSLVIPGQDSKGLTEENYVEEHGMTSWNWEEGKKKKIKQKKKLRQQYPQFKQNHLITRGDKIQH